ncbi:MAG TPA: hypothetical protein DER56_02185 [Thermosipho africanus]|nr:hypothetical protein [Thermosipho africanus]
MSPKTLYFNSPKLLHSHLLLATLGYKLPGAGGYIYMVAKEPEAAVKIREVLEENRPNDKARFVEMQLSHKRFQVSRS